MKTTERLTKQEFELGLKQFIGTQQYWEHKFPGSKTLRLTDGCRFVREEAEALARNLLLVYIIDGKGYFYYSFVIL